jgi:hypothetical protein
LLPNCQDLKIGISFCDYAKPYILKEFVVGALAPEFVVGAFLLRAYVKNRLNSLFYK